MLNAFAPRRGSLRGLRLVSFHSSSHPSALRVSCDGMDTLFRDLHDSPSGDKSDPAPRAGMSAEKPSVRVSLDLTGYEDYFKQAAKLKQDIWPDWGKMMSQHEPQGQKSEAKASSPASQANDTAAATPSDPTQQSPSYLSWDGQTAGTSLYRAFLQEFQSPTQGSVGNLVKRLVERAHKHEHQRLTQELSEKEKVLQEQASQLHAMTADRDKWMMDHQQLVASAKQQSKMTEAQLRAAASVTAKRADDEALHTRQKLAELQHQLSSQAGGDMTDRQTSGKSNSWDRTTSSQALPVTASSSWARAENELQSWWQSSLDRFVLLIMPLMIQVPYDLLIGADGVGSIVRSALSKLMPSHYERRYRHNQFYCTAPITAPVSGGHPLHASLQGHPLFKGGTVMWDARGDHYNQAALELPKHQVDAIRDDNVDQLLTLFENVAPNLPSCARTASTDLVRHKANFHPVPSWTYLSQMHGPKTVLLGDAAHTMHPVLGQGLNVGLEDAVLFVQCLERHGSDVDSALPAFNTERTPDIHAILTINEAVASGMGIASQDQHMAHTLWVWGHRVLLDLHMAVHMLLCSIAPDIFSEPVLVPLEMGTDSKPYRSLIRAIYCDAIVMAAILTSAAACAAHLLQSHLLSG